MSENYPQKIVSRARCSRSLGAMGSVVGMTRDALNPDAKRSVQEKNPAEEGSWDCSACGFKGITSKFCPECGAEYPFSDRLDQICKNKQD